MRVLGVDTATRQASVGLARDAEVIAERTLAVEESHAVSLLPLIEEVLQAAGCSVQTVDAIAVSCGPGSFTGLRIGLSIAKGLAYATGARLLAVPTLEALARTVAERQGIICPVLDARKGELYAARFESRPGVWKRLAPDSLVTPESLLEMLPTPSVVLGDAVLAYGAFLRERLGSGVTLLPFGQYGPRGGVVALMGHERLETGDGDDLSRLEPAYIRPSEAERKLNVSV